MYGKPSGIFIKYLMLSSRKYEKVGLLIVELPNMGARKNIWCFLQWRIIHEQQMNYVILRQRQRQRLFLNLCFTLVKTCRVEKRRRKRLCLRFEQNIGWFQKVWNTFDDERFKACFRMSRETFEFILNHIEHHLEHKTTAEQPIVPKERLAICLYRLIQGDHYCTIAEMTGHGLSTIQNITNEVCSVIISNL